MNDEQKKALEESIAKLGSKLDITPAETVSQAIRMAEEYVEKIPSETLDKIVNVLGAGEITVDSLKAEIINAVYAHEGNREHMFKLGEEQLAQLIEEHRGVSEVKAEKCGAVSAEIVNDENGRSFTVYKKEGGGTVEATEHADKDEAILTRVDIDTAKPVLDDAGNKNSWKVTEAVFRKKYDVPTLEDGSIDVSKLDCVKPKGGLQQFVELAHDVDLVVGWGKNGAPVIQHVSAGGALNVTDLLEKNGEAKDLSDLPKDANMKADVYGIAAIEFSETYIVRKDVEKNTKQKADREI